MEGELERIRRRELRRQRILDNAENRLKALREPYAEKGTNWNQSSAKGGTFTSILHSGIAVEASNASPPTRRQKGTLLNRVTRTFGSEVAVCLRLLLALIVACVSTASYAVPPVTVMSLACTGSTFVGITTHAMIWSSAYAEASDSTGLVTSLLHMVSAKAGWTADVLATVLQITSLVVQDLALSLFCVVAVNIALYLWTRS